MTFTYDLTTTGDSLLYSRLRLEIGDATVDSGVKPDHTNFSDAELDLILEEEGRSVGQAAARCFELLANWWARVANITLGPRSQALGKIAGEYREQAKLYRRKYGGGGVGAAAYGITRRDGYSDDVPSDQVAGGGGEYAGMSFRYVRPRLA